jgi:hypothetical protein
MKATTILTIFPIVSVAKVLIPDLGIAANNSLFEKWRPTFHFIGPNSWQNDPCTFVCLQVAYRANYHGKVHHIMMHRRRRITCSTRFVIRLHYTSSFQLENVVQYHPQHVQWGNISWGHGISKDMVTWIDAPATNVPSATDLRPLALVPSSSVNASKDKLGVVGLVVSNRSTRSQHPQFSGGAIPDGKGGWSILYTGVQKLPTVGSIPLPSTPKAEQPSELGICIPATYRECSSCYNQRQRYDMEQGSQPHIRASLTANMAQ